MKAVDYFMVVCMVVLAITSFWTVKSNDALSGLAIGFLIGTSATNLANRYEHRERINKK
jgi:hypothetical protein